MAATSRCSRWPRSPAGHHQQHGADRGEHRQPVLEQLAAALQQRGSPPGAGQHGGDEERDGGELRIDAQHAGEPDRDRRNPHDQRRVDLHHVDIEFTPGQPAPRDVEQPGDVVLQRRAQHGEQDDAEYGQQQQHAGAVTAGRTKDCAGGWPGPRYGSWTLGQMVVSLPRGGAGSMSCDSFIWHLYVVGLRARFRYGAIGCDGFALAMPLRRSVRPWAVRPAGRPEGLLHYPASTLQGSLTPATSMRVACSTSHTSPARLAAQVSPLHDGMVRIVGQSTLPPPGISPPPPDTSAPATPAGSDTSTTA